MVPSVDLHPVTGLSEQDAIVNLQRDGYNELPSSRSRGLLSLVWDSFQDPIFLLLVGGGIIYWILGDLQEAFCVFWNVSGAGTGDRQGAIDRYSYRDDLFGFGSLADFTASCFGASYFCC